MRRPDPLILGAGPAGCMAAIVLARGGATPTLIDRDAQVGDALCGGFLSWKTAERLRAVGIGPMELGAHPVDRLALFAHGREAIAPLPAAGFGLSRRTLDAALRRRAVADGARIAIDRARSVRPGLVEGDSREWPATDIFLASGKHDVRGALRPRTDRDPTLGLRVRIPAASGLTALLKGRIELHLFKGGYAGIVLQEDGSANICLAVRKSAFTGGGADPATLLAALAAKHPAFADRMAFAPAALSTDTVGAVPYGWRAEEGQSGIWRLGDQAAVIPSLAGEGMAIALASGRSAAEAWLGGVDGASWQRDFAQRSARPVRIAALVWHIAEMEPGARLLRATTASVPMLARAAMALTRI